MKAAIRLVLTAICAMPMLAWAGDQQEANKKVVIGFIAAMDQATARGAVQDVPGIVERYWTENCVQHRAGVAPGRAGVTAALQSLPVFAKPSSAPAAAPAPVAMAPYKTLSVSSEEDRVIMIRRRVDTDAANPSKTTEHYVFNIYRVVGGKIAENWWALSS
jgi:predicted SnoaL-like aldol condensation-catalyzing enzyme